MKKSIIKIIEERCKGCQLCISVCPKNKVTTSNKLNEKGYYVTKFIADEKEGKCTGCALCAIMCPDLAIEVYRD